MHYLVLLIYDFIWVGLLVFVHTIQLSHTIDLFLIVILKLVYCSPYP